MTFLLVFHFGISKINYIHFISLAHRPTCHQHIAFPLKNLFTNSNVPMTVANNKKLEPFNGHTSCGNILEKKKHKFTSEISHNSIISMSVWSGSQRDFFHTYPALTNPIILFIYPRKKIPTVICSHAQICAPIQHF